MLSHASACCCVCMSVCVPNKCRWCHQLCLSSGGDVWAVVLHHSGPLTMCWNATLQWNTAYYVIFGVLATMQSTFGCLWYRFQFIKLNTQGFIHYRHVAPLTGFFDRKWHELDFWIAKFELRCFCCCAQYHIIRHTNLDTSVFKSYPKEG